MELSIKNIFSTFFFKKKKNGVVIPINGGAIYNNCKKYMYVNFYTTSDNLRIIIYAPNFIGGGGEMCDLPKNFHKYIKENNLKSADIVEIHKDHCVIVLE